jgi:hypothetical protein
MARRSGRLIARTSWPGNPVPPSFADFGVKLRQLPFARLLASLRDHGAALEKTRRVIGRQLLPAVNPVGGERRRRIP